MRWRESATRLVLLGVAACCVASLPLEGITPDAATGDELLVRILPDLTWELWHGPTRSTRSRAVVSEEATLLGDGEEAWESQQVLEAAINAFCERRVEEGQPAIRRARVECPPEQSFRLLLEVGDLAHGHAPEGTTFSVTRWEPGLPMRLLPVHIQRSFVVADPFTEHHLDLGLVRNPTAAIELGHTEVHFTSPDAYGRVERDSTQRLLGHWALPPGTGTKARVAAEAVAAAVRAFRRSHEGMPTRLRVDPPRWDESLRGDEALALLSTLARDIGIDIHTLSFPDDWLDEIGVSRR